EEMAQQEQKFILGAVARGIKRDKAQQIFSLMKQFADYGFPKAHSVAYAYLAFQTAYLKAHFPEHFYAAVLSNEIEDTGKVFRYTKEMRGQGIELLPPDVNESQLGFTPTRGAIRYGLAAIKGIGFASVNAIIKARESGRFQSLADFADRVEEGAINKRVFEGLVFSGAFDSLKEDAETVNRWRARLFNGIDGALACSARTRRARALGQNDLFGEYPAHSAVQPQLADATPWTLTEVLAAEKKALGFYITGHPLDAHSETISKLGAVTSVELGSHESGSRATVAGLVTDLQLRTTKKGDRFAIFRLEDHAGAVKCVLWPEPFNRHGAVTNNDATVLVTGRAEISDDGAITVIVERVVELDQAIQQKARELVVRLPAAADAAKLSDAIRKLIEPSKGDCDVFIELITEGMLVRVRAHPSLKVMGSASMETALRDLGCEVSWEGHHTSSVRAAAASRAA
ncbi:MAG TPA: OB-fold nucleic acid binding domain-containing protein, partial [Pyrinomonadaceae bacterium]|nr:OB-fold nucleic acid binding domain-containing protein [Pyrinomonadaceae bacterium]